MMLWRLLVLLMFMALSLPSTAGLESFDFTGNVDEDRYKALITEVRCLVCQNQSLADSGAGLAYDLRLEVYELMDQGHSDEEVIDFLVSRYGDFVLYNPPVKPSTWMLWYGPFVLLLAGLILLVRNVRRRSRQHEAALSGEQQERLKSLLGDDQGEPRA